MCLKHLFSRNDVYMLQNSFANYIFVGNIHNLENDEMLQSQGGVWGEQWAD